MSVGGMNLKNIQGTETFVLGSAGTGLTFTRSWLGWPKPSNPTGYSIPCAAMVRI